MCRLDIGGPDILATLLALRLAEGNRGTQTMSRLVLIDDDSLLRWSYEFGNEVKQIL